MYFSISGGLIAQPTTPSANYSADWPTLPQASDPVSNLPEHSMLPSAGHPKPPTSALPTGLPTKYPGLPSPSDLPDGHSLSPTQDGDIPSISHPKKPGNMLGATLPAGYPTLPPPGNLIEDPASHASHDPALSLVDRPGAPIGLSPQDRPKTPMAKPPQGHPSSPTSNLPQYPASPSDNRPTSPEDIKYYVPSSHLPKRPLLASNPNKKPASAVPTSNIDDLLGKYPSRPPPTYSPTKPLLTSDSTEYPASDIESPSLKNPLLPILGHPSAPIPSPSVGHPSAPVPVPTIGRPSAPIPISSSSPPTITSGDNSIPRPSMPLADYPKTPITAYPASPLPPPLESRHPAELPTLPSAGLPVNNLTKHPVPPFEGHPSSPSKLPTPSSTDRPKSPLAAILGSILPPNVASHLAMTPSLLPSLHPHNVPTHGTTGPPFDNMLLDILKAHALDVLKIEVGIGIGHIIDAPSKKRAAPPETWVGYETATIINRVFSEVMGSEVAKHVAFLMQEFLDRCISGMHKFLLMPQALLDAIERNATN